MNLDADEKLALSYNIEGCQEPFWQRALWWIMIALVGGFIIGMLLISILG